MLTIRKTLAFLFLLLQFISISYAQQVPSYFDFSLFQYFQRNNQQTEIQVYYLLKNYNESDFTVTVISKGCVVDIYNTELSRWLNFSDPSNLNPHLSKSLLVKFKSFSLARCDIYLKVTNIQTGSIYYTPTKVVWGDLFLKSYASSVSKKLAIPHVRSERKIIKATGAKAYGWGEKLLKFIKSVKIQK